MSQEILPSSSQIEDAQALNDRIHDNLPENQKPEEESASTGNGNVIPFPVPPSEVTPSVAPSAPEQAPQSGSESQSATQ